MSRILPLNNLYRLQGKFVHVEFGNPKKKDCAGMGICNVENATVLAGRPPKNGCECCTAVALLTYVSSKRELALQFRRRDISAAAYKRQFATGVFRVEATYHFPAALARFAGLPVGAKIQSGTYRVREKSGLLLLQFPLVASLTLPATNGIFHPISATV